MQNTDRLCLGCMNDNGGETVCQICGYDSSKKNPTGTLKAGLWIEERFLIGKALEVNGEGINYIGWDNYHDCVVYIKEYFPLGIASRKKDGSVIFKEENAYAFNEGLLEFMELNRKVANLEDPGALLPVVAVFEHGGTAYAVSKAPSSSISLRDFLLRNGGTLSFEQVRPLFLPLFTTVSALHAAGIVHGGISPETILVCRDGKLRLSGLSIRQIRKTDSAHETQLFHGFAAPEQYAAESTGAMSVQTDVYAIAATVFRVLIGTNPPDATSRLESDNMAIPAKIAQQLPKSVLMALANALQLNLEDRTSDMEVFKSEFLQGVPTATASAKNTKTKNAAKTKKKMSKGNKYAIIASVATACVFAVIILAAAIMFGSFSSEGNESTGGNSSTPSAMQAGQLVTSYVSVEKIQTVPNLVRVSLAELRDDPQYENFTFVVTGKKYDDKIPRGTIITQNVPEGTTFKETIEIEVTISLGPDEIAIPNIKGLTEDEATILLFKAGFNFANIEFVDRWDPNSKPLCVIGSEPEIGKKADFDSKITIYINTYTGEETSSGEIYSGESSGN